MSITHCHSGGSLVAHSHIAEPIGSSARSQPNIRRRPGRYRHVGLATLLAMALTTVAANAFAQLRDVPWGPNQYNANEFEVRRDALPDVLPMDQIELVVEASDEFCKPKSEKVFGIPMPVPVAPQAAFFCRQIETYLGAHAGALPVQLSRQIWSQRKVADQVAALAPPPQRRYVLLSRWRGYDPDVSPYGAVRRVRWVVEEVLWDTAEGRLLWHSLRNIHSNDDFEGGRIWGLQVMLRRHFEFTLPGVLTRRGAARVHAPVPGGRWIPAADIAGWQSDSRAAIAFTSSYSSTVGGVSDFTRSKVFLVRAADQAPYVFEKVQWASEDWMRQDLTLKMAITPSLDFGTHALLELPAGRYTIDPYDAERGKPFDIDLKAGDIAVVEFSRNMVGADGPKLSSIEAWKKTQARGRHAFLEDMRVLPAPWQVETWFIGPR